MPTIQSLIFTYKEKPHALRSTYLLSIITPLQENSDDIITIQEALLIVQTPSHVLPDVYSIAGGPARQTQLNVTELLHVFVRRFKEHLDENKLKPEVEEWAALAESPASHHRRIDTSSFDTTVNLTVLQETILVYDAAQLRHAPLMRSLPIPWAEPPSPTTERESWARELKERQNWNSAGCEEEQEREDGQQR
ncbi:MAG: hypothetical protein LQ347_004500 [Umbilicaria vellea]|nr:MAG: hypothetical protein LQ347_004500 [Umbilicaria vellea]